MADFTALKTAIQNAIKQNGNEEITGNLLQEVLLAIVTTFGDGSINDLNTALGSEATTRQQADGTLQQNIDAEANTRNHADTALGGRIDGVVSSIEAINNAIENGYVYAGIATPSSTPTTGKVFYLALTAGTYTNFGNIAVTQGINILKYNGSAWSLDAFVGIDDAPTPSSNKLVKSDGVFNDIMTNGSAFDLSAYNNGTTYADLNAALTALNDLPAAYKKGGMSMKFVQSSDNKYVQYRLMSDGWSTTEADWQKQGAEVTLSQNSETGHTDITIGSNTYPVVSVEEIDGEEIYNETIIIRNGNSSNDKVITPLTDDSYGYCILSGMSEGSVAFVNASYQTKLKVDWEQDIPTYVKIPASCPHLFVYTKDNIPVSQDTQILVQIFNKGLESDVYNRLQTLENKAKLLGTIPLIDISERFPTSGTSGTDVYTTENARNTVPENERRQGIIISYKTINGIILEQYPNEYSTATAWTYGGWIRINVKDIINLNTYFSKSDAYSSIYNALQSVPTIYQKSGLMVAFKLASGWKIMQLNNDSWTTNEDLWLTISTNSDIEKVIDNICFYDKYQRVLLTEDYEIGGIDDSGNNVSVNTNLRTIHSFPVNGGSVIINNSSIIVCYYDKDGTYLRKSGSWTSNNIIVPNDVKFVRIIINNPDRLDISNFTKLVQIQLKLEDSDANLLVINREGANVSYINEWKNGYIDASGIVHDGHQKRCYTPRFVPVKKGDLVRANLEYYGFVAFEYSGQSESSFLSSTNDYYYNSYINQNLTISEYIVQNDGFIRLTVNKVNSSGTDENIQADSIGGCVALIHTLNYNEQKIIRDDKIYRAKINILSMGTHNRDDAQGEVESPIIGNGGTVINNELWCFGASEENDGYVRKFDIETKQVVSTITHDLGHANCVDYNANTDTLLVTDALGYESEQGRKVYLELISNPASKASLQRTDAIIIPLFVQDMSRYIYAQFCFGDADNILYGFEYHFWGTTAYKLLLGMGSNDYSQDTNGYGTFISGKTAREYNGTAKLVKTYTGKINEGVDDISGITGGAQDMCYDGYLYLCWSIGKQNILQIKLDELANTFEVTKDYIHQFYEDADGDVDYEPEVVTMQNSKIYAGSRHVVRNNNNAVVAIKDIIFSFEK